MKTSLLKRSLIAMGCAAVLSYATPSRAAGLLIADGGFGGTLEVKEHEVDVTINNGIAVTRVTQVFQNMEQRQVEALYTFPVPKGASVANFSMWINGKEMVGEVLEKKKAREIYESYKVSRRDPGLLEQVDYKTFEMRIFPIQPSAEQRVQITYYQELDVDHDWATYVYPLATSTRREMDQRTTGKFAFTVHAKSMVPITAVESPSHTAEMVVAKHTAEYYQASMEQRSGSLARDIVLAFNFERARSGFDLLASKPAGEDGYFALTLTPGEDLNRKEQGMDYIFLLDISGSMADDGKLLLSKDSVGSFIQELGPEDRFEVLVFNVAPDFAFRELRSGTDENKAEGVAYLGRQSARGGTVLAPALTTAFKYSTPDRPLNVIILSDGLTEQQDRATMVQLSHTRPSNTRIFCIGVGNDVNRPMLEQVAGETGGLAAFISRGDNFARQAKAFRRKLTHPAATGLEVKINGIETYDLEPQKLPNLYHGTPLRIYGRYKGAGKANIELRASVNGQELKQSVALEFPKNDSNPEIERMWAWHRIDGLLKSADAKNNRAPVIEEIVRLGEGYSIASEYTSFLVLENDAEYQRWKIARTNMRRVDNDRTAQLAVHRNLEAIRNKAIAGLGPDSVTGAPAIRESGVSRPVQMAANNQRPATAANAPAPESPRSQSINFGGGGGGGPVGPIFLLIAFLWRRFAKGTN
ncbi:MAG TPA: VIT and VWA domain-containing protein [Verrucomicrobiae bacterium]